MATHPTHCHPLPPTRGEEVEIKEAHVSNGNVDAKLGMAGAAQAGEEREGSMV